MSVRCPFCGYEESKVIDSRPTDEGERIRRRRECMRCAKRFTTYEVIESVPVVVVKKDKSREVFDRDKLYNGMLRACEKRPVSAAALTAAVDDIETSLQNSLDREVTLRWKSSKRSMRWHMSVLLPYTASLRILKHSEKS